MLITPRPSQLNQNALRFIGCLNAIVGQTINSIELGCFINNSWAQRRYSQVIYNFGSAFNMTRFFDRLGKTSYNPVTELDSNPLFDSWTFVNAFQSVQLTNVTVRGVLRHITFGSATRFSMTAVGQPSYTFTVT